MLFIFFTISTFFVIFIVMKHLLKYRNLGLYIGTLLLALAALFIFYSDYNTIKNIDKLGEPGKYVINFDFSNDYSFINVLKYDATDACAEITTIKSIPFKTYFFFTMTYIPLYCTLTILGVINIVWSKKNKKKASAFTLSYCSAVGFLPILAFILFLYQKAQVNTCTDNNGFLSFYILQSKSYVYTYWIGVFSIISIILIMVPIAYQSILIVEEIINEKANNSIK